MNLWGGILILIGAYSTGAIVGFSYPAVLPEWVAWLGIPAMFVLGMLQATWGNR